MTNIEKIRAMDSFDLAEFLLNIANCCYRCCRYGVEGCNECPITEADCGESEGIREWLESEATE